MSDAAEVLPPPGHNQPPLAEELQEETAAFRERRDALIGSVNNSRIDSPETAADVTSLGGMLADLRAKVEEARKARAKPFDDGKAAVQAAFKRDIIDPIDAAMDAARKMLNQWRSLLAQREAVERQKREAEAEAERKRAEEAEATRKAAEQAGDTKGALQAELEEMQAKDRAAALTGATHAIRPEAVIHAQGGSAVSQTQRVATVTDIGLCLRWLIQNQPEALVEAITPLVARLTRARVDMPGVQVTEQQTTRLRR